MGSRRPLQFEMEAILDNPNWSVNVIAIANESSIVSENILVELLTVCSDKIDYLCQTETTHIFLMYDKTAMIAGALLAVTEEWVAIRRICSSGTFLKMIQCLKFMYANRELHLSVANVKIPIYRGINFVKRSITGCQCVRQRAVSHLVWDNKPIAVKPIAVARHQKGVCWYTFIKVESQWINSSRI